MRIALRLALTLTLAALTRLTLPAHDHVEIGLSPAEPARLALLGPAFQLALHVPRGEPFGAFLPRVPGGGYATELSFGAEGNAIKFAAGSLPRVELVSFAGPTGAHFSFWEVGATTPTWTRPVGRSATATDRPSFAVHEDATGYGHIHGRAFTLDEPGVYQIVFRAVDAAFAPRAPSATYPITFHAQPPPQLSLHL